MAAHSTLRPNVVVNVATSPETQMLLTDLPRKQQAASGRWHEGGEQQRVRSLQRLRYARDRIKPARRLSAGRINTVNQFRELL